LPMFMYLSLCYRVTVGLKTVVFEHDVLCSLVEVCRRFRGACYLHRQFIALIMEAASPSETAINICRTIRHNHSEDSHLVICLKSHLKFVA
jgi:hypothetical protein